MANTVAIQGSVQLTTPAGTSQVRSSFSITPTGTKAFTNTQSVGTVAEEMAKGDCSTLGPIGIYNDTASGKTVTVTCEAVLVKPGRIAIFEPVSALVTLQSTGTLTDVFTAGSEQ